MKMTLKPDELFKELPSKVLIINYVEEFSNVFEYVKQLDFD